MSRAQQVTRSGTVHISYGESDTEALDVEGCEAFDEFEAHGDFVSPQTRAFRYIFVQTDGNLAIGHMEALYEYLPLENKGDFHCDDERLNRIYDVALHTLHLNSREFFLDGIKRDPLGMERRRHPELPAQLLFLQRQRHLPAHHAVPAGQGPAENHP